MKRSDLKFCPTCRNLLDKIEDISASKFILNCRTCEYIEEAEKKDYKVETRDFTRQIRHHHDSQFLPRLFQDPSLKRCISNCKTCNKKTRTIEWHSHRNDSMSVEYWCEECEQQQPSPHKGIAMLYDTEKSENSYAQLEQEGYCTDEERNELEVVRQEDF
ncbi:hypothetical protein C1646_679199 [Rhizophagus diaphanus]|nr:hypothetical protein C1646_679199 [Rhizophagus diaphanus] [Rhizophagus sp. MUCL 43196]